MVKSKYISDILELLLDGDSEGLLARNQVPFITEKDFEYTGYGVFVNFSHSKEIIEFKVDKPKLILNGVKIEASELLIEADATLFFNDGVIDYLEIWCYPGNYPKQDLKKYTLTQIWDGSPGKTLSIKPFWFFSRNAKPRRFFLKALIFFESLKLNLLGFFSYQGSNNEG
jgi:hypothetical protein